MENNLITDEDYTKSYFYEVADPDTGKKYLIPDVSDNPDLLKLVQDSTGTPKAHPPETRIAACALWSVLGNSYKVEKILGVGSRIIRYWMKEPWWALALREIRKAKNEELDAQFTNMMESTMEAIQDRLQHGESVLAKDGSLKQVPVSTRNLATLLGIVYDKRALLRADPNSKVAKTDVTEHLEQVATKLEKLVGKIPVPITVEGEIVQTEDEISTGSVE